MKLELDYEKVYRASELEFERWQAASKNVPAGARKNSKAFRDLAGLAHALESVRAEIIILEVAPQLREQFPGGKFTVADGKLKCAVPYDGEIITFEFVPNIGLESHSVYDNTGVGVTCIGSERYAGRIFYYKPGYGRRSECVLPYIDFDGIFKSLAEHAKKQRLQQSARDALLERVQQQPFLQKFERADLAWGSGKPASHFQVKLRDEDARSLEYSVGDYLRCSAEVRQASCSDDYCLRVSADIRFDLQPDQAAEFLQEVERLYFKFGKAVVLERVSRSDY